MLPHVLAVVFDLTTAAQASPRPRECRAAAQSEGIWLRVQGADAQRYCELLARGYARLIQSPKDALLAARAAEALAGPSPAVRVLAGRANLRLADGPLAYQLLQQAEASDAQAFADPKALHDYARAASLASKPSEAVRLYRLLVSRVALLDDPRERAFAQIEAAAHVLAHVEKGADEALGYLAHARQEPLGLSAWIDALRQVALRQSGRSSARGPSTALAGPAAPAKAATASFSIDVPLLPPAMAEVLAERERTSAAPAGALPAGGATKGKAR
jgi:hypothetical protein